MAWKFLGLNGRERAPDIVLTEIERGAKLGFSKVVVSSEEFSRALLTPDSFAGFARVCATVECELVITLRPLRERIHPELQEMVKNGQRLSLASPVDVLDAVAARPGLRPELLPAAIFGSNAANVTVIMVESHAPLKIFESMSTVVGESLPTPRRVAENVSYPFVQTAWLEALNRYAGLAPREARDIAEAAYAAAVRHRQQIASVPYPPLPVALERYVDGVWQLQTAFLDVLHQSGRIRLL